LRTGSGARDRARSTVHAHRWQQPCSSISVHPDFDDDAYQNGAEPACLTRSIERRVVVRFASRPDALDHQLRRCSRPRARQRDHHRRLGSGVGRRHRLDYRRGADRCSVDQHLPEPCGVTEPRVARISSDRRDRERPVASARTRTKRATKTPARSMTAPACPSGARRLHRTAVVEFQSTPGRRSSVGRAADS
jgi:hypothetical protein